MRGNPILAAEAQSAKEAGLSMFDSAVPCTHGHTGRRFTLDRKCVECNAIACRARHLKRIGPEGRERLQARQNKRTEREARIARCREISAVRKAALASGATTYTSARPCPKGHMGERYTGSGGCVTCSLAEVKAKTEAGYFREHYANNAERISARTKAYTRKNREKCNTKAAAWAKANKGKRNVISRHYKARRRSTEKAGVTGGMVAAWLAAQDKVCFYCSAPCPDSFHVDHFFPLAKGGAHVLTNLRIACGPCNRRKSAKLPNDWIEELSREAA